MNRENMLNHLAHTLPHWPTEYTDMTEPGHGWAWYDEEPDCTLVLCKGEEEIREADYAARRAELIKKPSWDDAPEWAEWLAQDYDGDWWWYECPIEVDDLDEEEWVEEHGVDGRLVRATSGAHPNGHDWRETLEQRPQTKSDIKKCKHCDVTFQRPDSVPIPDDRCTRCDEEISAMGWDDYPEVTRAVEEVEKQPRYQDHGGEDWIDEFARTATPEEFRGAMRFTVGKYNRRIGKKDAELSEVRKMRDYCQRWEAYLLAQGGEK